MLYDITRLYQDHRIPIAPRGHKHTRRGWVNTSCPFCSGTQGFHLGYNLEKGYHFCFRCGWHPTDITVQTLIQLDLTRTRKLLVGYIIGEPSQLSQKEDQVRLEEIDWPEGYGTMVAAARNYLLKRKFDPEQLERDWSLGSTRYWGPYAFRIVAPIQFQGQSVSWQTRDFTDQQSAKYLPCPKERELIPHKQILYGLDQARWKTVVVVEGITGVWRLGPGSVATFGSEFTKSQVLLLNQFDRILMFGDEDEAGQRMSDNLSLVLSAMGKDVEILEPTGCDSGDMPQEMADEIMREVRR